MQRHDPPTQWVHEEDYGSFELWEMVSGFFLLIVGLFQFFWHVGWKIGQHWGGKDDES